MITPEDLKSIGQEVGKIIEDNISPQFDSINTRLDRIETDVSQLKTDVSQLKTDMITVKSTMVTQAIFSRAMDAQREALLEVLEQEDKKVGALVRLLMRKNILNEEDLHELLSMPPFAKRSV